MLVDICGTGTVILAARAFLRGGGVLRVGMMDSTPSIMIWPSTGSR